MRYSFSRQDWWAAALGAGGCGLGALFEWGGLPFEVTIAAGAGAILCLFGFVGLMGVGVYQEVRDYLRVQIDVEE